MNCERRIQTSFRCTLNSCITLQLFISSTRKQLSRLRCICPFRWRLQHIYETVTERGTNFLPPRRTRFITCGFLLPDGNIQSRFGIQFSFDPPRRFPLKPFCIIAFNYSCPQSPSSFVLLLGLPQKLQSLWCKGTNRTLHQLQLYVSGTGGCRLYLSCPRRFPYVFYLFRKSEWAILRRGMQ